MQMAEGNRFVPYKWSQSSCGGQPPLSHWVEERWAARWGLAFSEPTRCNSDPPLSLLIFYFSDSGLQQPTWCRHIASSSCAGWTSSLVGNPPLCQALYCNQRPIWEPLDVNRQPPWPPPCLLSPLVGQLCRAKICLQGCLTLPCRRVAYCDERHHVYHCIQLVKVFT